LTIFIILLLIAFVLVPKVLGDDYNVFWEVNCSDPNPYNGFINDVGVCVPGVLTTDSLYKRSPARFWGLGDSYSPGVMEYVCNGKCRGYKDGIALMSCGDVGRTAWLKRPGHKWDGPFLVVDCSREHHLWMNVNNGLVVEWGYKTVERWGIPVVQDVIVNLGEKPKDNYRGWYYRTWWMEYAVEWVIIDTKPLAIYTRYREIMLMP